jgi:hypothetical protein
MPTDQQIRSMSRANNRLMRELDRFETACVANGLPLKRVEFINRPDAEFSELRVVYRHGRVVRK